MSAKGVKICQICGDVLPPGEEEELRRVGVKGICRACFERETGRRPRTIPTGGQLKTIIVERLLKILTKEIMK